MEASSERGSSPGGPSLPLGPIIEALPDPAVVVDRKLRIVVFNALAARMAATMRADVPLPVALRVPDIIEATVRVLQGGEAECVSWRERAPREQIMDVHIAPIGEGEGRIALITLHDMTEAHRVEKMRVDFVANASHELRTPLASLLGFVETLLGPAREDATARIRFLEIMRDQGRRMARLLDDLLQLSKIEQMQHVAPREMVDFAGALRHVLDALRPAAKAQGIELAVDAPERLEVPGARDELIRIAENLIENAMKYGVGGNGPARIDVTLVAKSGVAVFTVRDHGPGIAQHHLPRLTERFYRVDIPASRNKGGTGLGLAIVKHIAVHHRGSLAIESRPGEGSTFRVTLPLGRED